MACVLQARVFLPALVEEPQTATPTLILPQLHFRPKRLWVHQRFPRIQRTFLCQIELLFILSAFILSTYKQ
jgi:hypothetical protein